MHHTDHIIPEQPRPLPEGLLYFVGIGGAGMSAIAQVLAERGRTIHGADPGISATVKARLEKAGVTVYTAHAAEQIVGAAAVIVSDAIPQANPEVLAAKAAGLPIIRRPEALGAIVNAGRGIAIAGTHGKTTTTGMVASILMTAGLDPTVLIGGDLPLIGGNARSGNGDIVVAESCEAYDGFLYLHPEIAVVLNIEADHLDYHGDEAHVIASFRRFLGQVSKDGGAILCSDDPITSTLLDEEISSEQYSDLFFESYGMDEDNNLFPERIKLEGTNPQFVLYHHFAYKDKRIGRIRLSVPGMHNILNAIAAAGVALRLGISPKEIVAGLESFTGTGRRFERLGEVNGVLVVDDYAHHPTELRATLSAARAAYPDRRLIAVFQPHLPSRTRDLMTEFAGALAGVAPPAPINGGDRGSGNTADVALPSNPSPPGYPLVGVGAGGLSGGAIVFLTDIYLAREQPIDGVSSETLAERIAGLPDAPPVIYVAEKRDLPERLADAVRPGDLVITLGAGDIRAAGEGLLKLLTEKTL